MPPPKDVPSLLSVCGKSLEDTLYNLGNNFLINEHASFDDFSGRIESCKIQLCKIPSPLHNMLAEHCLKAADRIAKQYCSNVHEQSFKSQVVVQQLVSVVTHLKVKEVYFRKWSKPVQASFVNFLWKMPHLETLHYNASYGEIAYPKKNKKKNLKKLQESLPFLTNLTKFLIDECTDEVIATLCQSCELLEEIEVWCEGAITDKSIDSLVHCKNLRKVYFALPKVTVKGYMKLLVNTQSKNLVEIGDLAYFYDLLLLLESDLIPFRTFETQRIDYTEKFKGEHLPLISKYFPCITILHLLLEKEELQYFPCLDSLKQTEEVILSVPLQGPGRNYLIYTLRSQVLTSLILNSGLQISMSGLFNLGLQCPNLRSLEFEDCSFVKDLDLSTALSLERPFQKLKIFSFDSNSTSVSGAEAILTFAVNVVDIFIADKGSVTDEFFTSILKFNALEELRSLHIFDADLSLSVIKFIVLNCEKMTFLRNLAPSDNVYTRNILSKEEFESLQKFIAENNRNIDLQ